MSKTASHDQLLRDCRLLFGPGPVLSVDFLTYLQLSGVKSAFRQRARETHPDTGASLAHNSPLSTSSSFVEVCRAFDSLSHFVQCRDSSTVKPSSAALQPGRPVSPPHHDAAGVGSPQDLRNWAHADPGRPGDGAVEPPERPVPWRRGRSLYQGSLPERQLLLGHFLYYAGLVPWGTVLQALAWQRSGRPRLGELARWQGWLNEDEVRSILRGNNGRAKRFGEAAVDLALLSEAERRLLLGMQRQLQKKLGLFFVESHLFSTAQFAKVIVRFHRHNAKVNHPPFG